MREESTIRARLIPALFLASAALAGCGDDTRGPVDVNKLKAPSAEEQAAIQEQDQMIHDEEFGKPMPGSRVPKALQKR